MNDKPKSLRDLYGGGLGTKIMPDKPVYRIVSVPEHLKPFWVMYQKLTKEGFFDNAYRVFQENKDNLAPELTNYGMQLIALIRNERSIQRKHDFYQALIKFIDYLSGELGR